MKLTHIGPQGNARMVDVGEKDTTKRKAIAEGFINMSADTLSLIKNGAVKKGDVLSVALVAGIMAAKLHNA
jgi:cyclic pyranopterin phosphate synthase